MNNPYNTLNQTDPITADKWFEMNILELQTQRLILSDRHNAIQRMISGDVNPSIVGMYTAIGNSILQLDDLIANQQRKTENGRISK